MPSKSLEVVVKVADRATKPLRQINLGFLGIGRVMKGIAGVAGGLFRALTSVQSILAAVAGTAAVGFLAKQFVDASEAMADLARNARRLNVPVEFLDELGFVARRVSVDAEGLRDVLGDLQERMAEAVIFGTGPAVDQIVRLGLVVEDANGRIKRTDELFGDLITKLQTVPDLAEREFILKEIGGDEAARLLPLINQGLERFNALRAEARALGGFVSEESTAIAEKFGDAMERVRRSIENIGQVLVIKAGPALTEFLNRASAFIAAGASAAGQIVDVFLQALGSDENARRAQQTLSDLFWVTLRLLTPVVAGVGALGGEILLRAMEVSLSRLLPRLASFLTKGLIGAFGDSLAFAGEQLSELFGDSSLSRVFIDYADDVREGMLGAFEATDEFFGTAGPINIEKFVQDIEDAGGRVAQVGEQVMKSLGPRAAEFAGFLNELTGFTEDFAERYKAILEAIGIQLQDPTGGAKGVEGLGFFAGIKKGAEDAGRSLDTLGELGVQVGTQLANALASQATNAIVSFIDGTKSAGEAFRDFAAGVLRQIGQIILQLILLRTFSSIIGGLPILTGGVAAATGVRRYASGVGIVPGPNVNQDRVPAVLAAGEGVANRAAVRRNPGMIAFMNAGGEVGPVGFGRSPSGGGRGGGNIEINLTVQGSVEDRTLPKLKRTLTDAVLDAMRTSPSFRDQMRGLLA